MTSFPYSQCVFILHFTYRGSRRPGKASIIHRMRICGRLLPTVVAFRCCTPRLWHDYFIHEEQRRLGIAPTFMFDHYCDGRAVLLNLLVIWHACLVHAVLDLAILLLFLLSLVTSVQDSFRKLFEYSALWIWHQFISGFSWRFSRLLSLKSYNRRSGF